MERWREGWRAEGREGGEGGEGGMEGARKCTCTIEASMKLTLVLSATTVQL